MYTVQCFQVLPCITNNSIKYQPFVYAQLNDQTVLFQTIQFSMNTQFQCQTVIFDPGIGPYQVLLLLTKVELGAMAMKGYSAFLITEAVPTDCLVSYLGHSLVRVLLFCSDTVGVFCSPSRLDHLFSVEWWLEPNPLTRMGVTSWCNV